MLQTAVRSVIDARWSGLSGIGLPFFLQASAGRPAQPQPARIELSVEHRHGRMVLQNSTGEIRTPNVSGLSRVPLPVGLRCRGFPCVNSQIDVTRLRLGKECLAGVEPACPEWKPDTFAARSETRC